MAFKDWIWLIKIVMEILKLIADLPEEELRAIAKLRQLDERMES